MIDIVGRLNRGEGCLEEGGKTCISMDAESGCLCAIAADTITRLTKEVEKMTHLYEVTRTDALRNGEDAARLQAEVERLTRTSDAAKECRDSWIKAGIEKDAEVERLRAALDVLQAAMTAKKPIPLAFKKAIIEARAALNHTTQQEK